MSVTCSPRPDTPGIPIAHDGLEWNFGPSGQAGERCRSKELDQVTDGVVGMRHDPDVPGTGYFLVVASRDRSRSLAAPAGTDELSHSKPTEILGAFEISPPRPTVRRRVTVERGDEVDDHP